VAKFGRALGVVCDSLLVKYQRQLQLQGPAGASLPALEGALCLLQEGADTAKSGL
jgi:hypothetical protein